MSEEKTEKPTPSKLKKSREEGQVARSADVNSVATAAAGLLLLTAAGGWLLEHLVAVLSAALQALNSSPTTALDGWSLGLGQLAISSCLPLYAAVGISGGLAAWAQVGTLVSFEPIAPKFEHLDPVQGLKRLFSLRSLWETGRAMLKAICLAVVMLGLAKALVTPLLQAAGRPPWQHLVLVWQVSTRLFWFCLLTLAVLAALDAIVQRQLHLRDQRMSKDEVKRDHRESEGDPMLKGQRRQLAREAAMSGGQAGGLRQAQVLVTNPTHLAVGLRYASDTPLPIVVAKGEDQQALDLRREALEHGITIVEDVALARSLYPLPLFASIKSEQFEAVAAVLIWVAEVELAQSRGSSVGDGA